MHKANGDRKKGKKERKRDREMDVMLEEKEKEGMSPYITPPSGLQRLDAYHAN